MSGCLVDRRMCRGIGRRPLGDRWVTAGRPLVAARCNQTFDGRLSQVETSKFGNEGVFEELSASRVDPRKKVSQLSLKKFEIDAKLLKKN